MLDLYQDVIEYLNFTWEDEAKANQIRGYIAFAQSYLNDVVGVRIDFERDLFARQILKEAVLYLDSHAFNDFQVNYNQALNELGIKYGTIFG